MNLSLEREVVTQQSTAGRLFVDGTFEAYSLEPPVREVLGQPVSSWKVPGNTAIPAGAYKVIIAYSPKHQRLMPLLVDVPGFTGIEIHIGNSAKDTDACVLVGSYRPDPDHITGSSVAFNALFPKLLAAFNSGEEILIVVTNPAAS